MQTAEAIVKAMELSFRAAGQRDCGNTSGSGQSDESSSEMLERVLIEERPWLDHNRRMVERVSRRSTAQRQGAVSRTHSKPRPKLKTDRLACVPETVDDGDEQGQCGLVAPEAQDPTKTEMAKDGQHDRIVEEEGAPPPPLPSRRATGLADQITIVKSLPDIVSQRFRLTMRPKGKDHLAQTPFRTAFAHSQTKHC